VKMNGIQDFVARDNRGPCEAKVQLVFATVRAFEFRRDRAFKWEPAMLTKGRLDKAHLLAAIRTNKALGRCRARFAAELAVFRIQKAERGIQPTCHRLSERSKSWHQAEGKQMRNS